MPQWSGISASPLLDERPCPSPRPLALFLSLLLHSGFLGAMAVFPELAREERLKVTYRVRPLTPAYRERPRVYYYSGERLPEVSPARPVPRERPFRTPSRAKQQIAASPAARREGQFVWVPAPSIRLKQDLRAPNLVIFQTPAQAPPPAPRTPRVFQPPPAPASPVRASVTLPPPDTTVPVTVDRKLTLPPPALGLPAPPPPAEAAGGGEAPVSGGPAGRTGPGVAAAVIVGPAPANVPLAQLPEGVRDGMVAAGGEEGSASGGGLSGRRGAIIVPDLTIRGGGGVAGEAGNTPGAGGKGNAVPGSPAGAGSVPAAPPPRAMSVSAPLWPNSRVLPPSVEARFRERVVYSTVLVVSAEAGVTEEMVVWFGDREPATFGAGILMRPPVPWVVLAPRTAPRENEGGRNGSRKLLLAGVMRRSGRLESLAPIAGSDETLSRALIDTLQKWEFVPANRNGSAVDVDVVLEIPQPWIPAQRAQ